MKLILELLIYGAKIFSEERQRYYEKKSQSLLEEIQDVEDSDFYSKDMEAKGKAERELENRTEALRREFIKEAKEKQ